jgi:hypothetical protein
MWQLALGGVDGKDREILLVHSIQGRELIRQHDLGNLLQEADNPPVLENLSLTARQESPFREIKMEIGPGRLTSVTVEAEDHTWAIGRHIEIMEMLAKTRSRWAAENADIPEWPKKGGKKYHFNPISVGTALGAIAAVSVGSVLGVALLALAATFVFDVPYYLIRDLTHHEKIERVQIIDIPFWLLL